MNASAQMAEERHLAIHTGSHFSKNFHKTQIIAPN